MRVVALGGCGGMGRYAVRTAATFDFVDEVVVADLDLARAESFAEEVGGKASALSTDVEDASALKRSLRGADVVLNTVGPFYRFGVPILEAAIAAGANYLDINDDPEPTLEMLELDGDAREAGITAIIGMGASPGVSNLLALKAMSQLDSVHDTVTGWSFAGGGGAPAEESEEPREPSAALVHWMEQCCGTIRVRRAGEFVDVKPIEECKVEYPGIGSSTAWTVGHPEAVTLPRYRPEIQNSYNVMVGSPRVIEALRGIAAEIDAGRMSVYDGAKLLAGPPPREERPPSSEGSAPKKPHLPPLFATASGTKDGKPATVGATVLAMPAGGMGGSTGVPLAVALRLFAEGEIKQRGVFAPEAVIDPDTFFDALAPYCTPPCSGVSDMVLVSTS